MNVNEPTFYLPVLCALVLSFLSTNVNAQRLQKLLIKLDTTQNDTLKPQIYADLAFYYKRVNRDTCKMYADLVGEAALKVNDNAFMMRVDFYHAVCETNAGNYDLALHYMDNVLAYYEVQKDTAQIAAMLYQVMVNHYYKRDQTNFLNVANRSIRIYEQMGNKKKMASVINLKASFYKNLKAYDKALDLAKAALRTYEVENDSSGLAAICNTLGDINALLERNEEAMAYFERQHAINMAQNNEWGLGYSHSNLGAMFLKNGNLEKAEFHLTKSLAIRNKIKGKMELSGAMTEMARLRLQQQKYNQAIEYAKQSLALAETTKNGKQQKVVTLLLSKIYEKKGDYEASLSYFKQYEAEKDSLLNETISQQILNIETAYETQEKEKEIVRLQHFAEIDQLKITQQRSMLFILVSVLALLAFLFYRIFGQKKQIERQNTIISKALDEKDTLLREIHHRVKNNLQLVSSLLGLQSMHIDDPTALEAINSGKSRVKSMALIHQDLYHKENLTGVSVRDYIEKLSSELIATFRVDQEVIELYTDIPDLLLDVDTLIPLGLIINELLTNALKYAFPDHRKGRIVIRLRETAGQLQMEVSDNGIGIDLSKASDSSFGYKLIDTLLDQLEGEMTREVDNGTRLYFTFTDYKIAA